MEDYAALLKPSDTKVLLLVLDGLGGLPLRPGGPTELEAARTPHLDELARRAEVGLHDPVGPGITPGSGPGHLALFGYDPLRYRIGRGVLEALGVDFPLQSRDIAARGNFCTVDGSGNVVDRRAGRIPTAEAERLAERLDAVKVPGAETFVRAVKEHRFLLVLRPEEPLDPDLGDTDPGRTGVPPLEVTAGASAAEPTAALVQAWLDAARQLIADEPRANMALLRGFSVLPDWPSFPEVFGMRAFAAAAYPMYRGVAKLVGMATQAVDEDPAALVEALRTAYAAHDFFFLHFKPPDKAGEDGDFDRKVAVIEEADGIVPGLLDAGPDVVLVTGDHSTPSLLRSHSWHPVPYLLDSPQGRGRGADAFGERECAAAGDAVRRGRDLLPLAVAAAGRFGKFGA
ncbi:MAG: 2,3-bisphosphoglycerate-independent phosphoglycerate mutase [Gemmatimonadota bacterium]|nr:MAG: 2,3-bisphosphoglycerate-independent phosphoglycerate mutase [Gemmatimonadota bacterium]